VPPSPAQLRAAQELATLDTLVGTADVIKMNKDPFFKELVTKARAYMTANPPRVNMSFNALIPGDVALFKMAIPIDTIKRNMTNAHGDVKVFGDTLRGMSIVTNIGNAAANAAAPVDEIVGGEIVLYASASALAAQQAVMYKAGACLVRDDNGSPSTAAGATEVDNFPCFHSTVRRDRRVPSAGPGQCARECADGGQSGLHVAEALRS
jgi:hypothetical protein